MNHKSEKDDNDDGHSGGHYVVDARGSFDAANIQQRKRTSIEDRERPVRQEGQNILGELATNNGADERVEDVVHHDRPTSDVTERGIQFLADVGVSGTGGRIRTSHFAVADGSEEHGDHGDKDGGDHVTARVVADDAVNAHGRDGLNNDDADDDEVPETEDAPEFYRRLRLEWLAHSPTDLTRLRGLSTSQPLSIAK